MVAGRVICHLRSYSDVYHVHTEVSVVNAVLPLIDKDERLGWRGIDNLGVLSGIVKQRIWRITPIRAIHLAIHRDAADSRVGDIAYQGNTVVGRTLVDAQRFIVGPEFPKGVL